MFPQWNPGGTPYHGDAFSEGVDSFTGPGYGTIGVGRRAAGLGRERHGTAIFVLPKITVKGKGLYTGPAYNPLTDWYDPPDRTKNVAPSGGRPTDAPGSEGKPGAKKKKAPPSQGNGAFQDIVKGAWQRG